MPTSTTAGSSPTSTDETDRLISSSKVKGTAVYNREGARLGTVSSFMVDKRSGQVAYAVMSFGGFLGLGQSCHPLPWKALGYDTEKKGYVVDLDKDRLQAAPSYMEDAGANWDDADWSRSIDTYWERPDRPRDDAAVDAAVNDTFPASDPPSWSGGATGAGAPPKS